MVKPFKPSGLSDAIVGANDDFVSVGWLSEGENTKFKPCAGLVSRKKVLLEPKEGSTSYHDG